VASLKFKRGATFLLAGQYLNDDGTPRPLTGVELKSQVRDKDKLIATLVVNVTDEAAGNYQLMASSTAKWPTGTLTWDIKESVAGIVRYTQTMTLLVEASVTE
jgi:hypothetical protein